MYCDSGDRILLGTQAMILQLGSLICMIVSGLQVVAALQSLGSPASEEILIRLVLSQVVDGDMTVGQWVMIQAYLLQLAQPLAWLGTAWRIIQQGFIDMEKMFVLLDIEPEIKDDLAAGPLQVP